MTADARRALDGKTDGYGVVRFRREVDVLAWHIRRAIIVQREEVDLVRHHGFGDHIGEVGAGSFSCPPTLPLLFDATREQRHPNMHRGMRIQLCSKAMMTALGKNIGIEC